MKNFFKQIGVAWKRLSVKHRLVAVGCVVMALALAAFWIWLLPR